MFQVWRLQERWWHTGAADALAEGVTALHTTAAMAAVVWRVLSPYMLLISNWNFIIKLMQYLSAEITLFITVLSVLEC